MMKRIDRQVLGLTVLCLLRGSAAEAAKPSDGIVGTWRGSSTCVDREAAPACTDEQVVYDIVAVSGAPDKVTVKADKIVRGERVPMYAMDFTHEGQGAWTTEFETPRFRGRWQLVVRNTAMTGTLTLLPSKTVVRRVELRRDP